MLMQQLSSFTRRGLLGFISCLTLLLGMVFFTGTASAHTASPAQAASSHPHISVTGVEENFPRFGCVLVAVHGSKFRRNGRAELFASNEEGFNSSIRSVGVNDNGTFNTIIQVCNFLHREDIFSRDHGCFQIGDHNNSFNNNNNNNPFSVRNCFRQDNLLNNSQCFNFGTDTGLLNCFQQHQFFFSGNQILIVARDDSTGRHSNTVAVNTSFDNHF